MGRTSTMRLTIETRLVALLTVLGALLLSSTLLGNLALYWNTKSLQTVFDDRIAPLGQFSKLRDAYVDLIEASRTVRDGKIDLRAGVQSIQRERASAKRHWTDYLATYLTPEEKSIAADIQLQIDRIDAIINDLARGSDAAQMVAYPSILAAFTNTMSVMHASVRGLTDLQIRVAREEFESARATSSWTSLLLVISLAVAAPAIAYGVFTILLKVARPLSGMTTTMTRLAARTSTPQ